MVHYSALIYNNTIHISSITLMIKTQKDILFCGSEVSSLGHDFHIQHYVKRTCLICQKGNYKALSPATCTRYGLRRHLNRLAKHQGMDCILIVFDRLLKYNYFWVDASPHHQNINKTFHLQCGDVKD